MDNVGGTVVGSYSLGSGQREDKEKEERVGEERNSFLIILPLYLLWMTARTRQRTIYRKILRTMSKCSSIFGCQ